MATEPTLAPATFTDFSPQAQSPLFSFPPEIRYEIFACALSSAPDTTQPIDQDAYCTRPGYETISHTCTELLRTCKRVYLEAWFMPFLCSEHSFYMAWRQRSPKRVMSVPRMQACLDLIHARHGEVQGGSVRIFPQLWALQGTKDCDGVFSMKNFHPKAVTITIRYTDTWEWEQNKALYMEGAWAGRVRLPASVTKFKIDFESIERRKDEVDHIAHELAEKWRFRRSDGVDMVTSGEDSISFSRWTGSSTLGGLRWLRDETRPGQLDYYVGTVTWRPSKEPPTEGRLFNPRVQVTWDRPALKSLRYTSVPTERLHNAGVPETSNAEEAAQLLYDYESQLQGSDDEGMGDHISSDPAEESEEESGEEEDDSDEDW
ncbi:hypothetical protein N7493_003843 [Penicillium malachiteum]|uniref:Uncharacterized protein n=1 Tax=Penicillium malachiteum TaxID=1324776 RepID=A0AAD6HQF2_9EURO|nr:hypothetical protein N7493_003843 [Penicillium malachiteum]